VVGPNPANNFIQLNVPNNGAFSVVMSNLKGEIVFNKVNAFSGLKVNTSDLSSGLYLLKIKQKEGVCLKKIVVL
jgi:hypothetical protein